MSYADSEDARQYRLTHSREAVERVRLFRLRNPDSRRVTEPFTKGRLKQKDAYVKSGTLRGYV